MVASRSRRGHDTRQPIKEWDQLTIASETIGVSETASYISDSVQEPGIDGLARTNLRFS
jgi:hypothetical protein